MIETILSGGAVDDVAGDAATPVVVVAGSAVSAVAASTGVVCRAANAMTNKQKTIAGNRQRRSLRTLRWQRLRCAAVVLSCSILRSLRAKSFKIISIMQPFSWTLIVASIPFLTSMAFTPGPNNILVASSGVNFGFRATIPHILGITFGFPVMLLIVGLGLAKIFMAVPTVHLAFKYISVAYLLYLTWRVATAAALGAARGSAKPMGFMQAAAFQWVNVKAWIIGLSAVTTYTVVNSTLPLQIFALAVLSIGITLASVSCWTLFGHFLRDYLNTEARRRWFNYAMAGLLLVSIIPVILESSDMAPR